MEFKIEMCLERETKGALRYFETRGGVRVEKDYKIGTLYIRKTALPQPYPTILDITVQGVRISDKGDVIK